MFRSPSVDEVALTKVDEKHLGHAQLTAQKANSPSCLCW